jgi:hypothetical protein
MVSAPPAESYHPSTVATFRYPSNKIKKHPKNPVNDRWYENRTTRQISILTAGMIIHPPVDRTCGPSGQMLEEEIKKKERGESPTLTSSKSGEKRGGRE